MMEYSDTAISPVSGLTTYYNATATRLNRLRSTIAVGKEVQVRPSYIMHHV
jgi:hypothetical protein